MTQQFVITTDHRVLASGFEIGRIHRHPNLSSTHAPGKWFGVSPDHGILGIWSDPILAAVGVAHDAGYPNAVAGDVVLEPEASTG